MLGSRYVCESIVVCLQHASVSMPGNRTRMVVTKQPEVLVAGPSQGTHPS